MKQLRLGPFSQRRTGWLHVHSDPRTRPDVLAEPTELGGLPDGCAAVLEVAEVLERLEPERAQAALREWARVLAPGGELRLRTVDLTAAVAALDGDAAARARGLAAIYGSAERLAAEGEAARHRGGFTGPLLRDSLVAAGFESPVCGPAEPGWLEVTARRPAAARSEPAGPVRPPRSTDGRRRWFAWPDYRDRSALQRFFGDFARLLADRADCILVLGYDPARDGRRETVVEALTECHRTVLGAHVSLQITLFDAALDAAGWQTVSRHLEGLLGAPQPSSWPLPQGLELAVLNTPAELGAALGGRPAPTVPGEEPSEFKVPSELLPGVQPRPGIAADGTLIARAAALHPWFYPVDLAGHRVTPGLGSPCAPEWLISRARHRARLLVEGVLARCDLRGKKVLDLASNCGYWSSFYARAGAHSVFGLEGRPRHVEQARLYWSSNRFLPEGRWHFERGNLADAADWSKVRARGPFDVTLCAGILYHVANYGEILRWAAAQTRELLIVDTRVQDGPEDLVEEPGNLEFNAIRETRSKVTPNRERLLATLAELGLSCEVLPVPFGTALGVEHGDDYAAGARITVLCRQVRAARPATPPVSTATLGARPSSAPVSGAHRP